VHDGRFVRAYDEERQFNIELKGVTFVRFKNEQVIHDIDKVLSELYQYLETKQASL
jgi:very-short-patch-repair endonuclease